MEAWHVFLNGQLRSMGENEFSISITTKCGDSLAHGRWDFGDSIFFE